MNQKFGWQKTFWDEVANILAVGWQKLFMGWCGKNIRGKMFYSWLPKDFRDDTKC